MRTLFFLALVACGDASGTGGSSGEDTGDTGGGTLKEPPWLEAEFDCGGETVQVSCPPQKIVARLHNGAAVDIDCTGAGRVSIIAGDPALGDQRDQARDFFVGAVCPGATLADGVEYAFSEKTGEGTLVINSYEPGISISGTFHTDDGRLSGAFDVVETQ